MGIFISRGRGPNGRIFDSVFIGSADIPGAARPLDPRGIGKTRVGPLDRDIRRSSI